MDGEALAALTEMVTAATQTNMWVLSDAELVVWLDSWHTIAQQVAGVTLAAMTEFEARGLAQRHGASSTKVWLRGRSATTGGTRPGRTHHDTLCGQVN